METTKYYKGRLNPKFKNWAEAGLALNDPPGVYTRPENRAKFNTIVRQLARTANRRLTLLENKDMNDSPSYSYYRKLNGGHFNTDPASLTPQQIVREFMQLRQFLDNRTSTPAGFARVNEQLNQRIGHTLDKSKRKTLWDAYNKIHETHPAFDKIGLTSDEVQKMVVEIRLYDRIVDDEEIVERFEKRLKEIKEKESEDRFVWSTTQ